MSMFRFPPTVLSGAAGPLVAFLLAGPASAAEALNIQDAKEKGITVISASVDATAGLATQLRDTFIGQNFLPAFGSNQPRGVEEI
jgi:hypothetical protein